MDGSIKTTQLQKISDTQGGQIWGEEATTYVTGKRGGRSNRNNNTESIVKNDKSRRQGRRINHQEDTSNTNFTG